MAHAVGTAHILTERNRRRGRPVLRDRGSCVWVVRLLSVRLNLLLSAVSGEKERHDCENRERDHGPDDACLRVINKIHIIFETEPFPRPSPPTIAPELLLFAVSLAFVGTGRPVELLVRVLIPVLPVLSVEETVVIVLGNASGFTDQSGFGKNEVGDRPRGSKLTSDAHRDRVTVRHIWQRLCLLCGRGGVTGWRIRHLP
jgi:hypothetical protein